MHRLLLDGVRGHYRRPGELRSTPNWIGGTTLENAVFVPPPPDEMRVALSDWERFLHEDDLPLLVQLALAHYQFEVIHPFLDGNGRIGRLMIPLMLIVRGALPQPLLYLSAYLDRFRSDYYDHLLFTSQRGDLVPWLRFFLEGVRVQARDAEERTVRVVEFQHQLRDQLFVERCPTSVIHLAEQLFSTPIITAATAARMLGVTRPTAHAAINALVERGELVEITSRRRNRIYRAPRIIDAVYGDIDVEPPAPRRRGRRAGRRP